MSLDAPGGSAEPASPRRIPWALLVPLLLFAGGLLFSFGALGYEVGTLAAPKAGMFPLMVGLLLLAATGSRVLQEYVRPSPPPEAPGPEWRRLPAICLGIGAFIALLKPAGYLIASTILCGLLLRVLGQRPWWAAAGIALAAAVLSYFVFSFMGVPLPMGPLPF